MRIRNLFAAIPAALLFLWAASAPAATYYVSTTGNAANSGTQAAPWTLAKANTSLLAGDVAILAPGTYTTAITPTNSGTSGRYVTYIGSLSAPNNTIVTSITLTGKAYISVKGVRFGGDISITAAHDSLSYCNGTSGVPNITAATGDYLTVDHCALTAQQWQIGNSALNQPTGTGPGITDWILSPTITNTTATLTLTGYGPALQIGACRNATFNRSRFFITNGAGGYHGLMKMYGSRFGSFTNCMFDFTNTRSGNQDEDGFIALRDSSYSNLFAGDSFYTHGPGYAFMNFGSDGSWFPGSTKTQKWTNCQFRFDAPNSVAYSGVSAVYCFAGATRDTFTKNVVITNSAPFQIQDHDNSLISGNTFIGLNTVTNAQSDFGSWRATTVTNNIFYSLPRGATGSNGVALHMDVRPDPSAWDGNYNLYYCGNPSGSSLYVQGGLTGPGSSGTLCTGYSADCNSRYGDPLFVGGGTMAATFDPHLRSGSAAIGTGLGGVDIGALPFGGSGSDLTPPSAITNLAAALVTDNQAQLNWTAPGDDGTTGQASAYDIRRSTSLITALNFDSATPVANSLTPRPSGSSEQFIAQGLTPGTLVFFAIRAIDEASNRGAISNVISFTTTSTDTTPPSAIQDLSAQ